MATIAQENNGKNNGELMKEIIRGKITSEFTTSKSEDYTTEYIRKTSDSLYDSHGIRRSDSTEMIFTHLHYNKGKGYYFNFERKKLKTHGEILKIRMSLDSIDEPIKRTEPEYGPYGTQWIHGVQRDDDWDDVMKERSNIFERLSKIVLPEQKSEGWFDMRKNKITASDAGSILGLNPYEAPFGFVLKKTIGSKFKGGEACYHGNKYEEIATMIYSYRMNVDVREFGLLGHPTISFLGASPDGICSHYKKDKKHLSKFVGRMLEIKCPPSREIKTVGEINGDICPKYYFAQVQQQLECVDLEECDFWQCKITEYNSFEEFNGDTDEKEYFRSNETGFEKGCVIQLIPNNIETSKIKKHYDNLRDEIKNKKGWKKPKECLPYLEMIWKDSKFIHPPNIEMSPSDCQKWISEKLEEINGGKYKGLMFDRVFYWRLEKSFNVTIKRDREWFNMNFPIFKKTWDYVLFFREHCDKLEALKNYVDSFGLGDEYKFKTKEQIENNNKIMGVIDFLFSGGDIEDVERMAAENIKAESSKYEIDFLDSD